MNYFAHLTVGLFCAAGLMLAPLVIAQDDCSDVLQSRIQEVETEAKSILTEVARRHLLLINDAKKQLVESYFVRLRYQTQYLAGLPSSNDLITMRDTPKYLRTYRFHHADLESFMRNSGLQDIILADLTGKITYSTMNRFTGQAALVDAPYAETGLGKAFQGALKSTAGEVILADLSMLPERDAPAAFAAAPVFSGTTQIGVVIVQWPISEINHLMSTRPWNAELPQADIYGDTVETYIVSADMTVRSNPRMLVEKADNTLEKVDAGGLMSTEAIQTIRQTKSGVGLLQVDTPGVRNALSGGTGYDLYDNYRGEFVLSAYAPINVPGLSWAVLSEMEEASFLADMARIQKKLKPLCQ
ncbi:MAG: hypothetical protein AAF512_19150 [Pseudomonadota bacterium]